MAEITTKRDAKKLADLLTPRFEHRRGTKR